MVKYFSKQIVCNSYISVNDAIPSKSITAIISYTFENKFDFVH